MGDKVNKVPSTLVLHILTQLKLATLKFSPLYASGFRSQALIILIVIHIFEFRIRVCSYLN